MTKLSKIEQELLEARFKYSQKEYLTVSEAAVWLGVNRNKIYQLINEGIIFAFKPFSCNVWRIDIKKSTKMLINDNKYKTLINFKRERCKND